MVAGTAAEIGIAGALAAAISSLWRGAAARNEYKYTGRAAPPVHMIKLTREREIMPYPWVRLDDDGPR
jgi:hypothetical protein